MNMVTEDKAAKRLRQLRTADKRRSEAVKKIRGDVLHEYGPRPKIESPERRERSIESLVYFATESGYFPMSIGSQALCVEQIEMLQRLEDAIIHGGYVAHAIFRGATKSTALRISLLWSWLSGHRRYVPWIGQTMKAAKKELASIKSELRDNERLAADFPDFCYLFQCIGTNERLALNLKYDAEPVHMTCTKQDLVVPVLDDDGTVSRWCAMTTRGITADDISRGLSWTAPTGENMRPDGCVLDDIQSRSSANSTKQTAERLETVTEDIAQAGSVDRPFCILVGGTIIKQDDFMDQLVDPDKFQAWSGVRVAKLKAFPNDWTNKGGLWNKYWEIREDFQKAVPGSRQQAIQRSNEFYLKNQTAMDEGGAATWEHAFKRGAEHSAIQSCMNTLIDDGEKAFACECQQQPLNSVFESGVAGEVIRIPNLWWGDRQLGIKRGQIPDDSIAVTAGVDIQSDLMFWLVAAWRPSLGGHIVDYGTFPENSGVTIDLNRLSNPLSKHFPGMTKKAQLRAGLDEFIPVLLQREWATVSGRTIPTARILIDSGHEATTVYEFCSQSANRAQLNPSKGYGISVKKMPMADWKRFKRKGDGWVLNDTEGHSCQLAHFDGNIHKTRFQDCLTNLSKGDRGSISVFEGFHQMLGEHFHAEAGILRHGDGRSIYQWDTVKDGDRNDLLDCMMMSRVAAMIEGVTESEDDSQAVQLAEQAAEMERFRQGWQSQGANVVKF